MTTQLIEKFEQIVGTDPIFSIRAAVSPLFCTASWQEGPRNPMDILTICKGRDALMMLNDKNYASVAIDRLREYFQGKISIKELEEEYYSWEKDVQAFYDQMMQKDLSSFSNKELRDYAHRLNELFRGLTSTVYIETVDYEKVLGVVGPDNKERLDAVWEKATEHTFVSFEIRHLKKLVDIVSSNSNNKIREAKFLFTDYYWTKDDTMISAAIKEISDNLSAKTSECSAAYSKAAEQKTKHEEWSRGLDEESRKIVKYTQLVMLLRDIRKDPIAQIQAMFAELSVLMLDRAGVDTSMAPFVILYEYMEGVESLRAKKEEIEGRKNGCVYLAHSDGSYETQNVDFEIVIQEGARLIDKNITKDEVIKGQTACKGIVKGTARIIYDPHEDKGFQEGDILVTSMTRPEFVPLMKKAGAVVTNEGGITCHAAIVSRELNKPCIIGTKFATQLLKDGDTVEVDADKGVVRILEK